MERPISLERVIPFQIKESVGLFNVNDDRFEEEKKRVTQEWVAQKHPDTETFIIMKFEDIVDIMPHAA